MGTYLSTPVTDKHSSSGESIEYIRNNNHCNNTNSNNNNINNNNIENDNDDDTGMRLWVRAQPYVHWGVVEMQGWRKSMEDAHVTQTNVSLVVMEPDHNNNNRNSTTGSGNNDATMSSSSSQPPPLDEDSTVTTTTTSTTPREDDHSSNDPTTRSCSNQINVQQQQQQQQQEPSLPATHVFGVFDGHGGGEVARFVALYVVSVLQQQLTALCGESSSYTTTTTTVPLSQQQQQQQQLHRQHIGTALVQTFHALDRMIDDPRRREEILKLRTFTASVVEAPRTATNIPPPPTNVVNVIHVAPNHTTTTTTPTPEPSSSSSSIPVISPTESSPTNEKEVKEKELVKKNTGQALAVSDGDDDHTDTSSSSDTTKSTKSTANDDENDTDSLDHPMDGTEEACAMDQDMMLEDNDDIDQDTFDDVLVNAMISATAESDDDMVILPNHSGPSGDTPATTFDAMDTTHSGGHETTVGSDGPPSATTTTSSSVSGKVSGMLQRLLKLSGPAGQVILGASSTTTTSAVTPAATVTISNQSITTNHNNSTTTSSSSSSSTTTTTTTTGTVGTSNQNKNNNNNSNSLAMSPPSIVRNGQLICNLKDHPIHAGATAIVAVIHGTTLTVANAGDSRAVLCRGGGTDATVPLSTDHKPMQATELFRIINAGGFVNTFGRVNGNLNLSRSLGDLKYKQVRHLDPAQQMITAEPDIVQLELNETTDEFIIVGCDGIWDCLSNEKAVEFVAARINDYSPTEIGTMMLNFIISPDPRQTQGIGGDNMTILIIDLQPKSRRWYRSPPPPPPTAISTPRATIRSDSSSGVVTAERP